MYQYHTKEVLELAGSGPMQEVMQYTGNHVPLGHSPRAPWWNVRLRQYVDLIEHLGKFVSEIMNA